MQCPRPKTDDPDITTALQQLDRALEQPRTLARERIAQFRLDREKQGLPAVNATDTGAPLLDRDAAVRASYPNHASETQVQPWWSKLVFWRVR